MRIAHPEHVSEVIQNMIKDGHDKLQVNTYSTESQRHYKMVTALSNEKTVVECVYLLKMKWLDLLHLTLI